MSSVDDTTPPVPDQSAIDQSGLRSGRVRSACQHCGTIFVHVKCRPRLYCSKSCSTITTHINAKAEGRKVGGGKKKGFERPCESCGTPVYVKPHQEKAGFGRFCSRACQTTWQARNAVTRECGWCGKSMTMSPFRATIQKYCSWTCQMEGRRTKALDRIHNGRRAHQGPQGYVWVWEPDHPASYGGWYPEHRILMEQQLGRRLETTEHVHHINGIKDDNRLENLSVLTAGEHQLITVAEMVAKRRDEAAELAEYRRRFGPIG